VWVKIRIFKKRHLTVWDLDVWMLVKRLVHPIRASFLSSDYNKLQPAHIYHTTIAVDT
jgi:hypothetical protein